MSFIPGFWQVPGVHARPDKWESATEYFKRHLNPKQFEVESRLLGIARSAGCAPEFSVDPDMTIRLRKHKRLLDWLATANSSERTGMAMRVLQTVLRLHAAGLCHRDLKADDVVLDGERPLLVDFELGTDADPKGGCYDLVGPLASGIGLPLVHDAIGLRDGVWWDTPTTMIHPIWRVLGKVREIEAGVGSAVHE